jgi:hypothetical protein
VRRFALILALSALAVAAPRAAAAGPPAARYLQLAESGIAQANHWRDAAADWFYETNPQQPYPLLTIWGAVELLQGVDAVELVDPTPAHARQVNWFARKAEAFWNQAQRGYVPYVGWKSPSAELWFDDNGWLGLAFISAYQATGNRRYLSDAERAFDFILARGWDSRRGGLWWTTTRRQKSGEALAAGSLLGALLYQLDHRAGELRAAQMFVDWAQRHDFKSGVGLYGSMSAHGNSAVDYIQAPLIYAQYLLCQESRQDSYCQRAATVADDAVRSYGVRLNYAPQYDAIYLQWMLAYGKATGDDRFLSMAEQNADAAAAHASLHGLWLGSWWGGPIGDPQTSPGMLRTVGATTNLFAWLAYYAAG